MQRGTTRIGTHHSQLVTIAVVGVRCGHSRNRRSSTIGLENGRDAKLG